MNSSLERKRDSDRPTWSFQRTAGEESALLACMVGIAMSKLNVFQDDSDDEESGFKINKTYAAKFQKFKEKQELDRCK